MKTKLKEGSILLFEEKGFSETSVQDIAEAAGVTKGTFYYYFHSKEQLLMDIHSDYIGDLLTRQEAILKSGSSSREKITGVIELLIGDIQQHGPSGRVFFREMRHLKQANAEAVKGKREQFRLNIEEMLREGVASGEFRRQVHPDMAAFAILGATNWSYQWFNPAGSIPAEKLAGIFSDMILNGIISEGEKDHGTISNH
ncbi:MAG TPA: TetR/AcrR family transcriptional regulator [Planococcus sp. (in: firmicutes)]|nr:TetR/AcrR family transcriptional regulator [Planococcus sp. (in: firmicutes)]